MSTLRVYAQFTKSGAGVAPSAAPTVDVYAITRANNAVARVITAAAATPVAGGVYFYPVTVADLTLYEYLAVFSTADAAVDLQQVPALQQIAANADTLTTYSGNAPQSGDAYARIGANGAGLTAVALAPSGLDAVPVESGVNARQALSPILAAVAGVVSGSGTGSVVIKGGNVSTTRIAATTDAAGNRSAVALTLPS